MGSSTLTTPLQAADFPINSKFVFDKGSAAYVLTIELQNAIDIVILRSPVVLDLVDSGACAFPLFLWTRMILFDCFPPHVVPEIGTAVVSVTPPHMLQQARDDDTSHKFVAAFRYVPRGTALCPLPPLSLPSTGRAAHTRRAAVPLC